MAIEQLKGKPYSRKSIIEHLMKPEGAPLMVLYSEQARLMYRYFWESIDESAGVPVAKPWHLHSGRSVCLCSS